MNQPRNTEHTINDESQWRKTVKKLDSNSKNTGKTGLKSQTRQENTTKMKILLTYDSEVQMYARAYSEPRLANY